MEVAACPSKYVRNGRKFKTDVWFDWFLGKCHRSIWSIDRSGRMLASLLSTLGQYARATVTQSDLSWPKCRLRYGQRSESIHATHGTGTRKGQGRGKTRRGGGSNGGTEPLPLFSEYSRAKTGSKKRPKNQTGPIKTVVPGPNRCDIFCPLVAGDVRR